MASELSIIRNGQIGPVPEVVPRTWQKIAKRAMATLVKANARGDLYRVHSFAAQAGIGFNLVGIPDDYRPVTDERVEPTEMQRLFDLGYAIATSDSPWATSLPGISSTEAAEWAGPGEKRRRRVVRLPPRSGRPRESPEPGAHEADGSPAGGDESESMAQSTT